VTVFFVRLTIRIFRSDKLSHRLLPSALIECHSSCVMRSLAESRRMAPILRRWLGLIFSYTLFRFFI
jgi:hypothetical protein